MEIHRATDSVVYDSITDSLKEGIPPASGWVFAWIPAEGRIVKVADEEQSLRGPAPRRPDGAGATGRRGIVIFARLPPVEWDIVDPRSGTRTSLAQRPVSGVSPSRTGRYVAYFDRGHWCAYDTKDGSRRDLTDGIAPSFEANASMDRGVCGPIWEPVWLDDDRGLVAHDSHDAWLLSPDGTAPRRLTRGRERGRVYRLAATGGRHYTPGGPYDFHVVETRS